MNKPKIYIDGQEGTTGLQIYDRLGERRDIELLCIDPDKRKDAAERKKLLNAADLVFLCLPDAAAKEAVALIENEKTRAIDCSTAHRVASGWVYGFAVTPRALFPLSARWWKRVCCQRARSSPATPCRATPGRERRASPSMRTRRGMPNWTLPGITP